MTETTTQPETIGAGAMLEPLDGSRYAVRDCNGYLTEVRRDDKANGAGAERGYRWIVAGTGSPWRWDDILDRAAAVYSLVEIANADRGRWPQDVHGSFGLSYANYQVLPRTLMQSMPEGWQYAYVALVNQLRDAFNHVDQADDYDVHPGTWKYANECSDAELARAGAELYYDDPACEGEDADDDGERRYLWRGETYEPHDYIFVPGSDPVPAYNRGRTRIEPKIG